MQALQPSFTSESAELPDKNRMRSGRRLPPVSLYEVRMKKTIFVLLILLCIGLGAYLGFHYSIFTIPQRTSQVLIGESVTPLPVEHTQKPSIAPYQPTAEQPLQESTSVTISDILPVEEPAEPSTPYNVNGILDTSSTTTKASLCGITSMQIP